MCVDCALGAYTIILLYAVWEVEHEDTLLDPILDHYTRMLLY